MGGLVGVCFFMYVVVLDMYVGLCMCEWLWLCVLFVFVIDVLGWCELLWLF